MDVYLYPTRCRNLESLSSQQFAFLTMFRAQLSDNSAIHTTEYRIACPQRLQVQEGYIRDRSTLGPMQQHIVLHPDVLAQKLQHLLELPTGHRNLIFFAPDCFKRSAAAIAVFAVASIGSTMIASRSLMSGGTL